ncbi:recombinase family protein [Aminobacter aminovorans]|uniref:DNA invertase Pin-like site-specific DNA recombinase n=1 Tax=Aminobacter aminovorans TaxID=83263 RepID=A0AAC8YKM3_AMIAI|nr:recombinase family protein [Aminobacter aminovorans]AMS40165.1 Resolvase domain-containing protein [Aminobacter aminovorans]MBB3709892.1 DNA invertase Pin-like site-specific DNA recombinase [Aminobacter aminovorans]
MSKQQLRCAIYTRKSSEEGLDQEFNSLDAQREACAAFVASQIGLGWKLVADRYDDGGISGGTMERPALQRLLQDIRDRKIDVVVVYKIDRLTRSLMDFSRIVEIFDDSNVSFVSVTQQFNTTTSMGRLTLNVLLSFAQFEREVTAERIRDKIAASKKKGMWMGGTVPLGYAVQQRKLVIRQPEAGFVRGLFERYVQLRSVPALVAEVNRQAIGQAASAVGAVPFTRRMHAGMVYKMLANPLYTGKLRHLGNIYDGEHQPIVDNELFDKVQELMALGAVRAKGSSVHPDTHLLSGMIFDETGDRLRPTHATNRGKRYRYYISSRLLPKDRRGEGGWRVPASELENVVRSFAKSLLSDQIKLSEWIAAGSSPDMVHSGLSAASQIADRLASCQTNVQAKAILQMLFKRITLSATEIRFDIDRAALIRMLIAGSVQTELVEASAPDPSTVGIETIVVPIAFKRRGIEARLILDLENAPARQPAAPLVSLIAKAQLYLAKLTERAGITLVEIADHFDVHPAEISRLLPLAFLSPQLTHEILTGLQPVELSARTLARLDLSKDWSAQAAQLRS